MHQNSSIREQRIEISAGINPTFEQNDGSGTNTDTNDQIPSLNSSPITINYTLEACIPSQPDPRILPKPTWETFPEIQD